MKALFAVLISIALTFSARAENSDSTSVIALALQMMPKYPEACLGIESIPHLNETIRGKEAISNSRKNWASLGTIMAAQTDYSLEVKGNNILIKPKNNSQLHDGPVVKRPISCAVAINKWQTIGGALSGIKFKDKSGKFAPFLLVTSKTYSAEHVLVGSEGTEAATGGFPEETADNPRELSDALFLIARMANATTWSYQSSDGIEIAGKIKARPRKLTEGNLSFSGHRNYLGQAAILRAQTESSLLADKCSR